MKSEPVTVTPEVEKQLEGRTLVNGEFSFKIKEEQANKSVPSYEETVTNQNGKATFSKLTFNKAGVYTYTITEVKGSDTNVDYDGMTVKMTVTVTEKMLLVICKLQLNTVVVVDLPQAQMIKSSTTTL